MRNITAALLLLWTAAAPAAAQTSTARATQSAQTALDRYVAAADTSFQWKAVRDLPAGDGLTATLIDMTSQRWLTEKEVERPLWTHWITIIRPHADDQRHRLPVHHRRQPRSATRRLRRQRGSPRWRATPAPSSPSLRLVPNQPVVFKDDPGRKTRTEDDFIAYTWNHFIDTGDDRWPARLPMTKSAVRAMDAVTAFTTTAAGGGHAVNRFVVSGASKRGWTTWTTATSIGGSLPSRRRSSTCST